MTAIETSARPASGDAFECPCQLAQRVGDGWEREPEALFAAMTRALGSGLIEHVDGRWRAVMKPRTGRAKT